MVATLNLFDDQAPPTDAYPAFFTFGLDLLTVGRNDDTFNLMQLHVLGDLSETHDQAAFGFSLGRILLVNSLLEANQFLQEESHALIYLLTQHLVTIPAWGENMRVNIEVRTVRYHVVE